MQSQKSWEDFASPNHFQAPHSVDAALDRLSKNFGHFSSNYIVFMICICLPLTAYMHPYFVLVIAAGGVTTFALLHYFGNKKLTVGGQEVHHNHRIVVCIVVTIVALWVTSSVKPLFYSAAVGAFLGLLHSIFRKPPSLIEKAGLSADNMKNSIDKLSESLRH